MLNKDMPCKTMYDLLEITDDEKIEINRIIDPFLKSDCTCESCRAIAKAAEEHPSKRIAMMLMFGLAAWKMMSRDSSTIVGLILGRNG